MHIILSSGFPVFHPRHDKHGLTFEVDRWVSHRMAGEYGFTIGAWKGPGDDCGFTSADGLREMGTFKIDQAMLDAAGLKEGALTPQYEGTFRSLVFTGDVDDHGSIGGSFQLILPSKRNKYWVLDLTIEAYKRRSIVTPKDIRVRMYLPDYDPRWEHLEGVARYEREEVL